MAISSTYERVEFGAVVADLQIAKIFGGPEEGTHGHEKERGKQVAQTHDKHEELAHFGERGQTRRIHAEAGQKGGEGGHAHCGAHALKYVVNALKAVLVVSVVARDQISNEGLFAIAVAVAVVIVRVARLRRLVVETSGLVAFGIHVGDAVVTRKVHGQAHRHYDHDRLQKAQVPAEKHEYGNGVGDCERDGDDGKCRYDYVSYFVLKRNILLKFENKSKNGRK